jgi:hypothetical protein
LGSTAPRYLTSAVSERTSAVEKLSSAMRKDFSQYYWAKAHIPY